MERKKFPTKNDQQTNEVSCEKTQEIISQLNSSESPRNLRDDFSEEEIFQAQMHISNCDKCLEKFKNLKGRDSPNSN